MSYPIIYKRLFVSLSHRKVFPMVIYGDSQTRTLSRVSGRLRADKRVGFPMEIQPMNAEEFADWLMRNFPNTDEDCYLALYRRGNTITWKHFHNYMCHGFRNAKPLEDYGIPLVATMENGEKVSVTTSAELEKVLTHGMKYISSFYEVR